MSGVTSGFALGSVFVGSMVCSLTMRSTFLMSAVGRTVASVVVYVLGVVFLIVALFGLAAVFAPLLGFAKL